MPRRLNEEYTYIGSLDTFFAQILEILDVKDGSEGTSEDSL